MVSFNFVSADADIYLFCFKLSGQFPKMFGGGHAMRPTKADGRIKVTDHLIWINYVPFDGEPRRIAARSGESLLMALERHRVPGIWADCNGGDQEN